jgi:hypothetical protein
MEAAAYQKSPCEGMQNQAFRIPSAPVDVPLASTLGPSSWVRRGDFAIESERDRLR